ncbi:MAG: hypothetical protein K2O52_07385, partial [Oscillospiraceae bacterium]|nr:hypothetical protein [Oscillospiraceae bacterium]
MTNRIKGITVESNSDTTKLSRSLESVNKNIKNTQTQLKDMQKLMTLDPPNTEFLFSNFIVDLNLPCFKIYVN